MIPDNRNDFHGNPKQWHTTAEGDRTNFSTMDRSLDIEGWNYDVCWVLDAGAV